MDNIQKSNFVRESLKAMPKDDREKMMNDMLSRMVDDYPNMNAEDRANMRSKLDGIVIDSHQQAAAIAKGVAFVVTQVERIVEFDKNIEVKFDA